MPVIWTVSKKLQRDHIFWLFHLFWDALSFGLVSSIPSGRCVQVYYVNTPPPDSTAALVIRSKRRISLLTLRPLQTDHCQEAIAVNTTTMKYSTVLLVVLLSVFFGRLKLFILTLLTFKSPCYCQDIYKVCSPFRVSLYMFTRTFCSIHMEPLVARIW